jgi:hypothetical protein
MVVGYTEIADRSIPGIKLELGTVTNSEVQDRSLTAVKLVMGTITRDEMADLTINDSKVANRAITGTKLVAGTITSTEIGSRVIASGNIALQAVTTSELQDGSVTSAKINPTLKPSSGAALGTEALRAIGYNAGMAMPGTPNRINVVNSAGVGADFFLTGQRTGEANYRYLLRNDGLIYWGGGGSGVDCWMYRLNLASPMGTGMAIKTASGGLTIDSAAESDRSVLRIGSITWNPSPGDRCIVFDRGSDKPLTPSDGGVLWVDTNGQLCYVGSTGQKHVLAGN